MTVGNLIKLKNDIIGAQSELSLENDIRQKINLLENIASQNQSDNYTDLINKCIFMLNELSANSLIIDTFIENIVDKIENDVNLIAEQNVQNQANEESLIHNHLSTNEALENIICSRISSYSDWRFPGLQLHCRYYRPQNKNYPVPINFASPQIRINHMVANDPLYLLGSDIDHLKEIISSYNNLYQNRLRLYEVKERNLSVLPYSQFGFILCWDFLNYLSIQTVRWYLNECIKLLRPGGVLMFSYNNGELTESAKIYDTGRAAWATEKHIRSMVSEIGYNILRSENHPTNDNEDTWVSWYEVQKSGELKTVRLCQAKGQVLTK